MVTKNFESIAALANWADVEARSCRMADDNINSPGDWYGPDSWSKTIEKARNGGEETYVSQASSLMERIQAQFEATMPSWVAGVAGAYPCVPDALIGLPESMRRRVNTESDNAPISIWIPTTCSAGIDQKTLIARGVAYLAFAMALVSSGRAVELYAVAFGNGNDKAKETVITARIPTNPLSLSEACFALCNVSYTRRISYAAKYALNNGCNGRWPEAYASNSAAYCVDVAKRHGITFCAPPAYLTDAKEIAADPVKWLNSKMAGITALLGEREAA